MRLKHALPTHTACTQTSTAKSDQCEVAVSACIHYYMIKLDSHMIRRGKAVHIVAPLGTMPEKDVPRQVSRQVCTQATA